MSAIGSSVDPCEWYARLQRSYFATGDEAALDELTDLGRLLAVTGIPVESVLEAHGAVLVEALVKAGPQHLDALAQASSVCLSQLMVAWRIAAEGLADSAEGATSEPALPPVFMLFDRDGALSGDPEATSLQGKLAALGASSRLAEVGEALRHRRLTTFDLHPADRSDQVLRAVVCPFRDGSGMLCIHDVSANRAAAELLFQRRKLASLGQLAGGIAHEINNLLQPILSVAQFIGEDRADDPVLMEDVQIILDSARSAANVVRDVLAFARRGASDLTPINLASAVEREMAILLRSVPTVAQVVTELSAAPVVMANRDELAQVLRNLVGNAVEVAQGRVTVSVAAVDVDKVLSVRLQLPAGRYARLSVADDGPGITAETARRIFEPFFTTKAVGKGTGLGLAIVRGVVGGWGGTVSLRQDVTVGAVFDVFVPVADMATVAPTDAVAPQAARAAACIMVVDDDATVGDVIARVLMRAGYTVRSFTSAEAALKHFDDGSVELVLSDWMLPGMNGFAFVKELRRRQVHVPALMLSGNGLCEDELRRQAAGLGVAAVLFKPVAAPQLLAAVQQGLEEKDMPGHRQVETTE